MKYQFSGITAIDMKEKFKGDGTYMATYVSGLGYADHECLTFYKGDDIVTLSNIKSGIIVTHLEFLDQISQFKSAAIVFTKSPMKVFAQIVQRHFSNNFSDECLKGIQGVSTKAYVESEVVLGKSPLIFPNSSIFNSTVIGDNVEVQSGTVIGGVGMSYAEEDGIYTRLLHLGNVKIGNNVTIGCNTTVLRGILESTEIKSGCKIGNHVNVGHNSTVGENCYVSAGAVIGGAATIGKNCWIAMGVNIRDHVKIGDNCIIGVGSVVVKDTEPNSVYYGNPAKLVRKNE